MAYLNEFPNLKPNELNLNWILEQYSSFNDKLQELHDHFDSAINDINASIDEFENEVNNTIENFETRITTTIGRFEEEIRNEVNSISSNIAEYVGEHMNEWQLESMVDENNDIIIGDYDPEEPITDGGVTNEIIINNTKYTINQIGYVFNAGLYINENEIESAFGYKGSIMFQTVTRSGFPKFFDYLTKLEDDYGLDVGNNYIDVNTPYIITPDYSFDPTRSDILNYHYTGIYFGMLKIMKVSSSEYRLSIDFTATQYSHEHATSGLNFKITMYGLQV